jgi:hypothetical protein
VIGAGIRHKITDLTMRHTRVAEKSIIPQSVAKLKVNCSLDMHYISARVEGGLTYAHSSYEPSSAANIGHKRQ